MIRKRQHYISIIMSIVLMLSLFSAVSLDEEKKVEAVSWGKWNSIYFGRYWQNDTNGDGIADQNDAMQAIQWRVLKTTGNYALLLSDKILDAGKFYNGKESTWETSDLRNWLNSTFYKTAFNEKERNAIQIQTLKNYNEEFKNIVLRSNSTKDKVFVPSHTDMTQTEYGFEALYTVATNKRCASNTQYTAAKAGMYASTTCADAYWLRDSSNMLSDVQTVLIQGIINPTAAVYAIQGIRPMIYVDLTDTSLWQQGDLISAGDFSESGSYNSVQNDSDGNLPTSDDYYPFGKVEPEVTEDPDITTPVPAGPEKPQNVYTAQGAWTGWGGADAYPSGKDHEAGDGANNYYNKETTNMSVSQGYNCGLELMNPYNPAFTGADNEMAVFIKKMKSPVIRVTTKNGSAASGWNWHTELSLPSGQEVSLTSSYLSSGYFALFGNDDTITKVEIYDKNQENGNDNTTTSEPEKTSQETPITSEPQKPDGNVPVTNAPASGTTDQPVTASPAADKPSASPVVKRTATPSAISYHPSYTKHAPSKPGRVNLKKVKALRRGQVKVTWNKVYGADKYQVQYSAKRSFAGKRTNIAYGKSTYLYLKKRKTYYVRVRAVKYGNSANNYRDVRGSWSTVKKVKTKQ